MPLTNHPDPRPFHPLAALFPLMSEAEVTTLADDIATHGLHMPIVLDHQGRIVDGRNRYHALQRLGNATAEAHYTTTDLDGAALVQYVVSLNLHRRHLNESQRALVAAKLANLAHGGDRKSSTGSDALQAANLPLDLPPADVAMVMTQAEAAALLNVSERMVRDAKKVQRGAVPALVSAVEQGALAVSTAVPIATLPQDEQDALVTAGKPALLAAAKRLRTAKAPHSPGSGEGSPPLSLNPPAPTPVVLDTLVQEALASLGALEDGLKSASAHARDHLSPGACLELRSVCLRLVDMLRGNFSTPTDAPAPVTAPPPFDPKQFRMGNVCKHGHIYQQAMQRNGQPGSLRHYQSGLCVACTAEKKRLAKKGAAHV